MMGIASTNSMTKTWGPKRVLCTRGMMQGLPSLRSTFPARSRARRSSRKSSSEGKTSLISSTRLRKSRSGDQYATWPATVVRVFMSSIMSLSTPSCCTFTATTWPVLRNRALCTWAMDAEATGSRSKLEKTSRGAWPRSFRIMRNTSSGVLTGRWSVNDMSSEVISSGSTPTMVLMTCPALMKHPFASSACFLISTAVSAKESCQSLSCSGPGPRASESDSHFFMRLYIVRMCQRVDQCRRWKSNQDRSEVSQIGRLSAPVFSGSGRLRLVQHWNEPTRPSVRSASLPARILSYSQSPPIGKSATGTTPSPSSLGASPTRSAYGASDGSSSGERWKPTLRPSSGPRPSASCPSRLGAMVTKLCN
mmetsp:Transcript_115232/g.366293  ORF Transcript_115232/g.366293 Transcript_115232/m.366293 type:complete len:364 (+) Transcript_115232:2423-3514(+)